MNDEYTVELEEIFPTSAETLFRAWIEPDVLSQWFVPEPGMTAVADNDLRTGGDYNVTLHGSDGREMRIGGLYHEINPPRRLSFTWRRLHDPESEDSYVELTFDPTTPDQTRLTLFHDELLTAAEQERRQREWQFVLQRLATFLAHA